MSIFFYSCLLRELLNKSSITIVTLVLTPLITLVLTLLSLSHFGSYTVVIYSLWVLCHFHPFILVLTLFINSFVWFLIPFVISVYGSSTVVTSFYHYHYSRGFTTMIIYLALVLISRTIEFSIPSYTSTIPK